MTIEVISYGEVKGNDKQVVDTSFENLINDLKSKYDVEILSIEEETNEEENDEKNAIFQLHKSEDSEINKYVKIGEFHIKFKNFKEYIEYCLNYGADVDVISPSVLKIDSKEFAEVIGYIVDFFQRLYNAFGVVYNVKKDIDENIDIEKYKKGIYDEDEVYDLMEEEGLLKFKVVFETRGKSEEEVIKRLISEIKDFVIINKVVSKELESKNIVNPYIKYYGVVMIEILCNPIDLVDISYKFLPVAISTPLKEINIDSLQLQDIGNELGGAVFEITHTVVYSKR